MTLHWTLALLGAAVLVGPANGAPAAKPAPRPAPAAGPVATYWMSASTTSGMGGMGMGAGGRGPGPAAMMRYGAGADPNAHSQSLVLQLGSSRKPGGPPSAEHLPPPGLGAGASLPLVTPPPRSDEPPGPPPPYQQPRGRMLIFWGCGEHAPAGQPVVIDFARLGQGAGAQQFAALSRGMGFAPMQPPSPNRNATYGEWPNAQSRASVPSDGSLQGSHTIRGNYTPDITFSLAASQDFLPPFRIVSNQKNPSGSATLAWRPVDGAQAYFATMFGARGQEEMVMWTSSASQASAFALPDYLSDGEIGRMVASHALMAPTQTSCVVPQEAVRAAGDGGFFNLAAYGGETNIANPPRPAAPIWTVKVRYRSATSGLLGMSLDMGGDAGQGDDQDSPRSQSAPQQKPRKGLPGLGNVWP